MKVNKAIRAAFRNANAAARQSDQPDAGIQAVLDHLDPIPGHVEKLHDRDRVCWRRSVDDPQVWATAGRSRVATARRLMDQFAPLTWNEDGK